MQSQCQMKQNDSSTSNTRKWRPLTVRTAKKTPPSNTESGVSDRIWSNELKILLAGFHDLRCREVADNEIFLHFVDDQLVGLARF